MSTPPALYMEYGPLYLFLSVQKHITVLQQTITHSVNQAMRTVSARPCGAVRAHVRPCTSMRAHASFSTTGFYVLLLTDLIPIPP